MQKDILQIEEQQHLFYAGHILVLTLWIQNVLTDLLILMEDPQALNDFKTIKKGDPKYFEKQLEGRRKYDQWILSNIINKLYELDPELKSLHENQFLTLEALRNFFAHGRYSLKRSSVLFQPDRGKKRNDELIRSIMGENYVPIEQFGNLPLIWKPEWYNETHKRLMVFEYTIFPKIAQKLGININRIK